MALRNRGGILAVLSVILSCLFAPPTASAQDAPRPGSIYIVADDLGFADTGFQGSAIATLAPDALAEA